MIHRSAEAAFVFENRGPSGVVGGLSHRKRVTAGAAQALWVESVLQVVVALLFTQQSFDGKLDHLRIPAGRLSIQKDHNTPKQHRLHLFADMSLNVSLALCGEFRGSLFLSLGFLGWFSVQFL
jgi:hypothetical protein